MSLNQIGWMMVIIGGIISFSLRFSMIALLDKIELPDLLKRALNYVPATVLTAIFLPAWLLKDKTLLNYSDPRIIAGFIALLVAWRTKNILATIAAGMFSLWSIRWLITSFMS